MSHRISTASPPRVTPGVTPRVHCTAPHRLQQLYYDRIHPSDLGHTVLALALAHLFKRAALLAAALAQPHAAGTAAAAAAPRGYAALPTQLLAPMDKTVDPASTVLECLDASSVLQPCVIEAATLCDRGRNPTHPRL